MAKSVHNDVIDAALDYIADNGDKMIACSAEPTNHTEATSTYALADVAMTEGEGNDYTKADGDTSGRKVAVAEKASVTVDATGTVTHLAIVDDAGSKLLYVTTVTSQAVTSGNTITIPTWDIEIADPS